MEIFFLVVGLAGGIGYTYWVDSRRKEIVRLDLERRGLHALKISTIWFGGGRGMGAYEVEYLDRGHAWRKSTCTVDGRTHARERVIWDRPVEE